jgi:hypothetical protein
LICLPPSCHNPDKRKDSDPVLTAEKSGNREEIKCHLSGFVLPSEQHELKET